MSNNTHSYIGITSNTAGEVVIIVGDDEGEATTQMSPGAARRVAVKLIEEAEIASKIGPPILNGHKEVRA